MKIFDDERETVEMTHDKSNDDDDKSDVMVIDVELDNEELAALRLPPKTSVLNNLNSDTFDLEIEVSNAKLRYNMLKNPSDSENKKEEQTEDEICEEEDYEDLAEMLDAEARETFTKKDLVVDLRKKRVTDLKLNNMVKLPKALTVREEAEIAVRTNVMKETFENYKRENCGSKGKKRI